MPFDIGIGLILGVVLSGYIEISYSIALLIGVSSTLLPDIDYLWSYFKNKKQPESDHRDGLHYPLVLTPVAGAIGYVIDPTIGLFLAVGTFLHFIHDSIGVGFGIKWLYPFVNRSYLFLFQIKTPANHDMPKKRFYSWNDQERAEMIQKYGYSDWIRYVYLRPNLYGMFEYLILLTGISTALYFGF